jgi:hypothetical protein
LQNPVLNRDINNTIGITATPGPIYAITTSRNTIAHPRWSSSRSGYVPVTCTQTTHLPASSPRKLSIQIRRHNISRPRLSVSSPIRPDSALDSRRHRPGSSIRYVQHSICHGDNSVPRRHSFPRLHELPSVVNQWWRNGLPTSSHIFGFPGSPRCLGSYVWRGKPYL